MIILPLLYIIFFLSGAAGLMYQIVWTRMLLLVFGSTTHSVVAVVSAFMAGLALGSYSAPRLITRTRSLLQTYGLLELTIGVSALFTPLLFIVIQNVYSFSFSFIQSPAILLGMKFIFTFCVLLPVTSAMGATLPVMVAYLTKKTATQPARIVSLLYAVNTCGAFLGVLATGYVFIELFGLTHTIFLASLLNISLAVIVFLWNKKERRQKIVVTTLPTYTTPKNYPTHPYVHGKIVLALAIFGISGFIAMAYEIAWTRLLTPFTGTYIYAFSLILSFILLGIAIGSFLARVFLRSRSVFLLLGLSQLGIGLGAIGSVLVVSSLFRFSILTTEILVLVPATICMGLMLPLIARLAKEQDIGRFVGTSYAINTIGSMIGPIVCAFTFLPTLGTTRTIIYLAAVNLIFSCLFLILESKRVKLFLRIVSLVPAVGAIMFVFWLSLQGNRFLIDRTLAAYMDRFASGEYTYLYKEDETAAVLGYKNLTGSDYGLLVDGVGMSVLVDETKLMAHLPLLLHPHPKDALVVAFGMGTTFRSALTHNVNVDAVELVPSVPDAFPIFFHDAALVQSNPKGHVIINDGRNYIRMTNKMYDVITIDPPPPVNSAGTTVLYSREFYQQSLNKINNGGIVSQWFFYGTRVDDFQMLIKSFVEVFPYVAVFTSPRGIGIYALGSDKPIIVDKKHIAEVLQRTPAIMKDLNEWGYWNADNLVSLYAGDKEVLKKFAGNALPVTDDHPRTEYFLLRQRSTSSDIARNETLFR